MTLPAGFEFVGKIGKQPEGCWCFQDMRNLSGYYQLEGNILKGITTDKKEPRDYECLLLNDNVMVLTKAPQNIGSDYRGATLRRGAKPKMSNATSSNTAEESSPSEAKAKLAEAKRKLAEFEYTKAIEANKKVPGSISSTEIERLKANFDIANAELDAAKLGVDIRRTEKSKDGPSTPF